MIFMLFLTSRKAHLCKTKSRKQLFDDHFRLFKDLNALF